MFNFALEKYSRILKVRAGLRIHLWFNPDPN